MSKGSSAVTWSSSRNRGPTPREGLFRALADPHAARPGRHTCVFIHKALGQAGVPRMKDTPAASAPPSEDLARVRRDA